MKGVLPRSASEFMLFDLNSTLFVRKEVVRLLMRIGVYNDCALVSCGGLRPLMTR